MCEYHGHATLDDGTHIPLSRDEAEALWQAAEKAKNEAAAEMPATDDALNVMQRGRSRLRDLGWREAQYCPKDGTPFAVIMYGSVGIFEGWYMGEWPKGHIYCCDYLNHPHGMLFKAMDDLTDAERDKLTGCMAQERADHEREIQCLIAMDQVES